MATIVDKKSTGLILPIRPFTLEEHDLYFEELARGQVDRRAVEREHIFKKEVINALSHVQERIAEMQGQVSFQKASLRLTITSNDLSTTDETDDTITCLSQTPYAFDFTDSRRFTKVVLSPMAGREPHELMFDKVIKEATGGYTSCVYPVSATKLQLVNWNGASWDAVAFDEGWVIDISQYIDGDLPVLTA